MFRVVFLSIIFCICIVLQSSAADITQTRKSKNAAARFLEPLDTELSDKGLSLGKPVFLRITKTQSEDDKKGRLEAFVENDGGEFVYFKSWDICTYSGALGPKLKQGDGQSPEGFYFVKPNQMNPYSSYHLSFNLGYPNAFDRAHKRTGDFLMVHGDCVSIGCYAMTDKGIEEIYTLMAAAMKGGQPFVRVHVFPFPMTDENLEIHKDNTNIEFWKNLKIGWDWFEDKNHPPNVNVSEKKYSFNSAKRN